MKIYIDSLNIWLQGLDDKNSLTQWAKGDLNLPDDFIAPKPKYYPKGQLRRLSPFSRVILHSLDFHQALTQNLPFVFASQHGDLAKTVNLIKDAALNEDLSPTQFALSVHNATTGLFSITTKNTAATTTISAGVNTFVEGLIEASLQCKQENTSILYSYCDFDVPDEYRQYQAVKPARGITMLLSNEKRDEHVITIDIAGNNTTTTCEQSDVNDVSLSFIKQVYLQKNRQIQNEHHTLSLVFN